MKSLSFLLMSLIFPVSLIAQSGTDAPVGPEQGRNRQVVRSNVMSATLKSAARLFEAKNDLTTVITIIPSGSRVTVLDSDSTYYKVKFEDSEGYIFKRQALIDDPSLVSPPVTSKEEPKAAEEAARDEGAHPVQKSNISRFTYLENKYGTSVAARINSGKIWKGMNGEMVRDSWGNPEKISRVISNNTVEEEWTFRSTTLYFQNNKLVKWGPRK